MGRDVFDQGRSNGGDLEDTERKETPQEKIDACIALLEKTKERQILPDSYTLMGARTGEVSAYRDSFSSAVRAWKRLSLEEQRALIQQVTDNPQRSGLKEILKRMPEYEFRIKGE